MNYYRLCQDPKLEPAVAPAGVDRYTTVDELADRRFAYVRQSWPQYVDFLATPPPMISDRLKTILEQHSPATRFTRLVLIDPTAKRQTVYWALQPPLVDCLSAHTVFDRGGREAQQLALARPKLPTAGLFGIQGLAEPYIIVNLAAAESILRRYPWGVLFERIEIKED